MRTIDKGYKTTLEIKRSQFVCRIFPAKDSKEAKKIISCISEKYKDATHNCSAYIVTDDEGYDDDGEPGGTAGKPMLNILKKNGLANIVAIVTRYFGGVKLGAGGLVRAYGKSVLEAIKSSKIIEMEKYNIYEVLFEYSNIKSIENEIRSRNINILNKEFKEKVNFRIALKTNDNIKHFQEKIKQNGKINYLKTEYLNKLD
ncbi:MAG: YigZ family protein [Methanobrevibacter arboriphilus]|uniref:YigZ family protein n=1 Tax=Methanobrevibacter arboriphilus TaxID=39441 RepID=A0A843ACW5_METAZ|nr:YigZ family protein [Methanobrevibacter arboriphilus]MBF4469237.1 YigZ family protein [Methanobrevibacter arboriphilus]